MTMYNKAESRLLRKINNLHCCLSFTTDRLQCDRILDEIVQLTRQPISQGDYFCPKLAFSRNSQGFLFRHNSCWGVEFRIGNTVVTVQDAFLTYCFWYDFPENSGEYRSRRGGFRSSKGAARFNTAKDAISFYMRNMYRVTDCPFQDIFIGLEEEEYEPIEPWAAAWLELNLFDQQVAA